MTRQGPLNAPAKTSDWITPPRILLPLGEFDLDPACPDVMPWETAKVHYSHNGLEQAWVGRVWLNPPFHNAGVWLEKLAEHGNGIALVPGRTESRTFFAHIWYAASSILFLRGRPHFYRPDGTRAPFNSGGPICLVAYGKENDYPLANSKLGRWVKL
jgi:hypothetical protein